MEKSIYYITFERLEKKEKLGNHEILMNKIIKAIFCLAQLS